MRNIKATVGYEDETLMFTMILLEDFAFFRFGPLVVDIWWPTWQIQAFPSAMCVHTWSQSLALNCHTDSFVQQVLLTPGLAEEPRQGCAKTTPGADGDDVLLNWETHS